MILYPLCNVCANCRWKKLLLLLLLLAAVLIYLSFADGGFGWGGWNWVHRQWATGSHEEGHSHEWIIWPGAADRRCSKWWSQQQLCKKLFEEDNLAWRLSVWCLAQCCCSSSKSLEAVYYYYYSSLAEKRKRKTRLNFWIFSLHSLDYSSSYLFPELNPDPPITAIRTCTSSTICLRSHQSKKELSQTKGELYQNYIWVIQAIYRQFWWLIFPL